MAYNFHFGSFNEVMLFNFKLRLGFGIGFVERRRESWGKFRIGSDWVIASFGPLCLIRFLIAGAMVVAVIWALKLCGGCMLKLICINTSKKLKKKIKRDVTSFYERIFFSLRVSSLD